MYDPHNRTGKHGAHDFFLNFNSSMHPTPNASAHIKRRILTEFLPPPTLLHVHEVMYRLLCVHKHTHVPRILYVGQKWVVYTNIYIYDVLDFAYTRTIGSRAKSMNECCFYVKQ